jgi:hypothetical protein
MSTVRSYAHSYIIFLLSSSFTVTIGEASSNGLGIKQVKNVKSLLEIERTITVFLIAGA